MSREPDPSLIDRKSPLRMIMVAGTFDDEGGKASSYMAQFHAALPKGTTLVNGGAFSQIPRILEGLEDFDVVLWFPNVPNDKEKIRDIKKLYPEKLLITSKRNHANEYPLHYIVAQMLKLKSNLAVEFSASPPFAMKLIDPLANTYENTTSPETMARAIMKRIAVIAGTRRQGTRKIEGESRAAMPDSPRFFSIIRDKAADFHRIMTSRLGTSPADNSGYEYFRCERGFPSFRDGGFIFVSKRDFANCEQFVLPKDMVPIDLAHFIKAGEITYWGPCKPAMDTPIHLYLYAMFPKVRFILHSHEHVEGAPFTSTVFASETLEEVDEIIRVFGKNADTVNVAVNLLGHGSMVLAGDLDYLQNVIYEGRPLIDQYTRINGILVGGSFDAEGGKSSALISELQASLPEDIVVKNGGTLRNLESILGELAPYEIVMWFPQVPDGQDDFTAMIKESYPFKTLIAGIFNQTGDLPFQSMINRSLGIRSSLFVEFRADGAPRMRLYDPLSNQFADTVSPAELGQAILARLDALRRFSRQGSISVGRAHSIPAGRKFDRYVEIVRIYGTRFHNLIHPAEGVGRFLGNTAFRASYVFPKYPELKEIIFISQRNLDKRGLGREGFVAVRMSSWRKPLIEYFGPLKPSVDTPTQTRFMELLPDVNYILHSHVYIQGAPFTHEFIPCGSLEEVEEVLALIGRDQRKTNFAVNLLGHGSLIFARDLDFLEKNVHYIARPKPEPLNIDGRPADAIQRLRNVLARKSLKDIRQDLNPLLKLAAVAALVRQVEDRWQVLLTKRVPGISYELQWVLPGGKMDAGETGVRETALRECSEEMGVVLPETSIIGELPYVDTLDGRFRIGVAVAYVDNLPGINPSRDEIEDFEWVSVEELYRGRYALQRGPEHFVPEIGESTIRVICSLAEILTEAGALTMDNPKKTAVTSGLMKSGYFHQVELASNGAGVNVALVLPNLRELESYAIRSDLYFVRPVDLVNHPKVQELLWDIVEDLNRKLPPTEGIAKLGVFTHGFWDTAVEQERVVRALLSKENRDKRIVTESTSGRELVVQCGCQDTVFEPETSEYFESEGFARAIAIHCAENEAPIDGMVATLRQEFRAGRSEHYSRLLGMNWKSGTAMYRTMEDFFAGTESVRFYRVMYKGSLAGRIVVNEDTGTLVDALIFAPSRGNHLGDVIIKHLNARFGGFNSVIPSGVPIFNFFMKRGFAIFHSEAIGPIDLAIISQEPIEKTRMAAVRKLHAVIRNKYANALLGNFSEGDTENSNLYRNFPEVYDLLYSRFSQRLGDYLKIIRDHTPDGGAILDAAAGTGEVSIPLLQAGYRVVSADLNPGMLDQLKLKAAARSVKPHTVVTDFFSVEDLPGGFDTLSVRQAINYLVGLENLRRGFRSFCSALKDGGKLVFNAPNYDPAHFVPPVKGPSWVALNNLSAIVWESNTIDEHHMLTHHQKAIIWSAADRHNVRYCHDVNVFQMYTKYELERALVDEGFSRVEVLSSSGKDYDPADPAMYFIATSSTSAA